MTLSYGVQSMGKRLKQEVQMVSTNLTEPELETLVDPSQSSFSVDVL